MAAQQTEGTDCLMFNVQLNGDTDYRVVYLSVAGMDTTGASKKTGFGFFAAF